MKETSADYRGFTFYIGLGYKIDIVIFFLVTFAITQNTTQKWLQT